MGETGSTLFAQAEEFQHALGLEVVLGNLVPVDLDRLADLDATGQRIGFHFGLRINIGLGADGVLFLAIGSKLDEMRVAAKVTHATGFEAVLGDSGVHDGLS